MFSTMKRIFKPVSKNELVVSAASMLVAAVLYLIGVFIKVTTTDLLQMMMFALAIAASCYKMALTSIQNLLEGKLNLQILNVVAVLAVFLGGGKASAAIIAIFFGFADLATTYFEICASDKYFEKKGKIKYTVITDKGEMRVPASHLKVGSVVRVNKSDFLCFDGKLGNEKIVCGYYDDEPADITVETLYNVGVDFHKAVKAEKINTPAVKLANVLSIVLPAAMFVIGLVFTFLAPTLSGQAIMSFTAKIAYGSPIMILGLAKVAVSGVYFAAVLNYIGGNGLSSDVKAVVINKNKALCRGEFAVADVAAVNGIEKEKIVELCLAVQPDDNAYARAFAAYLNQNVEKIPAEFTDGEGFVATLDETSIAVGSKILMDRLGIDTGALAQYNVFVAVNGNAVGSVRLSDRLKSDAVQAVKSLKEQGKAVYIITSDSEMTAKAVADKCEADGYFALCSSKHKAEKINGLKSQYGKVAYIGDDKNALTVADRAVEYVDENSLNMLTQVKEKSADVNKLSMIRIVVGLAVIAVLFALCVAGVFKIRSLYIAVLIQFAFSAAPEYLFYRSFVGTTEKKVGNKPQSKA